MMFLGKWTFTQAGSLIQIDSTGALIVGAPVTDGSDRFNAYGSTTSFTLQAGNGKYLERQGSTYQATATQSAGAAFSLDTAGSGTSIVVVDNASKDVWSNNGGVITATSQPANPSPATEFTKSEITPGVDAIIASGFTSPAPDLRWVDLAGTDFTAATNLDFTKADLGSANLSETTLPPSTGFRSATATKAVFDKATLDDCDLSAMTLTGASFRAASMTGIDLSNSTCTGADFSGAKLADSLNLASAVFDNATLVGVDLTQAANIVDTSFVGANLTGTDFTGASVTGAMDLSSADCTAMTLCNPKDSVTVFPDMVKVDSSTNFRNARLMYLDLTGYDLTGMNFAGADLTGCKLDKTTLAQTNFGFAILDETTITGGVAMAGANLSNASLRAADLTGAQLGGLSQLFRVGQSESDYTTFLDALKTLSGSGVASIFSANGRTLSGAVTVRASTFAPGVAWEVDNANDTYSVLLESLGAESTLTVYLPTTAAVLSNAFMVDVNLKSANLYNVRASGAQLYATAGNSVNLNLAKIDGLQVNNANMGAIDLSRANLAGVNMDYAVLTGADFTGATLTVDATGGQASLNGANLQGAKFPSAIMHDVIFTNAAMAVPDPNNPAVSAGVRLFELDATQAGLITPELDRASPDPDAKPSDPRHTFTIPISLIASMATPGPVDTKLIAAFAKANITLDNNAVIVPYTTEVFWKLAEGSNEQVIFRTVDDDYRPALGVAPGSVYTPKADYSLPLSTESALRNGPVTSAVKRAFKAAGHPIDSSATITTGQHPVVWQVISGADVFTLWILFESGAMGTSTTIVGQLSSPNLVAAFGSVSMPLSIRATVTRLSSGGWKISNDANNPFNSARGYIEFVAIPSKDGSLTFYGSLIRIVRSSGPDQLQFYNIACDTTQLSELTLAGAGNTICPNGALVSANQDDKLPFANWLAARLLPRPPNCVPDPGGSFFCPT